MRILIIVPAYNEEDSIVEVVASLKKENPDWDILVINDASTDDTERKAMSTGQATVLTLPCNLGIGGGVQTGFKFANRNKYDIAVKFDGDGQHKADEITNLLNPMLENKADVCVGSRFCEKRETFKSTFTRRIGIRIFSVVNSLLIGQLITDNTSGFRAYNKRAIHFLASHYPAFDYPEPEEIILLGKNGFQIKEIFTEMRERQGGKSSISAHRSVYYMVKVMLAIFMVASRPKIHFEDKQV